MADFLEERLSRDILMGASFYDEYSVNIVTTSGGQEYRSLIHPFPARVFDVSFLMDMDDTYTELLAMWHRAHGRYAGFRVRCYDEYSSNGRNSTPTAYDQPTILVSSGIYQLVKQYGTDKTAGASGYPYRVIYKPVSGTVKVAINGAETTLFTVSTTTGRVTMGTNITKSITSISKSASAVIEFGTTHSFVEGQSIHISGVSGMTQINGLRGTITTKTSTNITVNINSSAFSNYTSGGTVNTFPQTGETVSAGFEFDIPVRFNSSFPIGQNYPSHRDIDGIELIEILNP
jgi:uncharacterized protein (TIGR02217 family)